MKLFDSIKLERWERDARKHGFYRIYKTLTTFVAEDDLTHIELRLDINEKGEPRFEISWKSAGIPRPTMQEVKRHIEMLQEALALKKLIELDL